MVQLVARLLLRMLERRVTSILLRSQLIAKAPRVDGSETNFRRIATAKSVSVSWSELRATARKWAKSFADGLAWPSAMLAGTETAARVTWLVSPNCSRRGNVSARSYTRSTRSIAFCQTNRSLYDAILSLVGAFSITSHSFRL